MLKTKENKGITLIALIVTIVVLLILAGVSISMLTGDNGLLTVTARAKEKNDIGAIQEEVDLYNNNKEIDATLGEDVGGSEDIVTFVNELKDKDLISNEQKEEILTTGKMTIGDETIQFVQEGDWVDYDAGVWTQEEIDELTSLNLYAGEEIQEEVSNRKVSYGSIFKFSGVYAGKGKDSSVDPNGKETTYEVKNKYQSGWRVCSLDNNVINILSAGTVEIYSLTYGEENGAISSYILSSGKYQTEYASSYSARNYDMYVNGDLAISARCLIYDEVKYDETTWHIMDDLYDIGACYWSLWDTDFSYLPFVYTWPRRRMLVEP